MAIVTDDRTYRTPVAFRAAIEARLRTIAAGQERPYAEVRREFVYQRFLARVFDHKSGWVLKGGVGMLIRVPGARHTRDIDLLQVEVGTREAEDDLRMLGRKDLGDYLRFEIVRSIPLSVEDALRLKVDAYVGTSKWESFDIDISCEVHFVASIESFQPTPIVTVAGMHDLPPFQLYPLVDQIADKVSAMYETHGQGPSNRYRDLVDLVFLSDLENIDAAQLVAALEARRTTARSPLVLPKALNSPGSAWEVGFTAEAMRSSISPELRNLDAALSYVAVCLNSVLDGSVQTGRWDPTTRTWRAPE
jgi:hypothetical protein